MAAPKAQIPLVDLKVQYRAIEKEIGSAIAAVLTRCDFIGGKDVELFEQEFAAYCGSDFAVGCANGTDALQLACMALDIGPGDEVIVPAMTFVATALGVTHAGAQPVFVDVDRASALIDLEAVAAAITPKTKAIMPVHLFGQCCDMDGIMALAREHGLRVIEDAAQAHGAIYRGRRAGVFGDIGSFSFYPGKNLGAYGDAGGLVTNDPKIADRLRVLRNLGSRKKYYHEVKGVNSRLDTLQAAVLRVKLPHLEAWNAARRRHARSYDSALSGISGLTLTKTDQGSAYHLYVVRAAERDTALRCLNDAGIGAAIHYPIAVHELDAYRGSQKNPASFPESEAWSRECLTLPMYPELPDDVPGRAAKILRDCLS